MQADIEAVAALGGHSVSVVTALTAQDSRNVQQVWPVPEDWFSEALRTLLDDVQPDAIKIGLLGDVGQIHRIAEVIDALQVPVVLDPILRAGGGKRLLTGPHIEAIVAVLLPKCTVITPNAQEARQLSGCADLHKAGTTLLTMGPRHVLITGGDENTDQVHNFWFSQDCPLAAYTFERWPQAFHGAGCTLASAIAVGLAQSLPAVAALERAQHYTHAALGRGMDVGRGRQVLGRFT